MDKGRVYVQLPTGDKRLDDQPDERESQRKATSETSRDQESVTPGMNKPFTSATKTGAEITDGEDG